MMFVTNFADPAVILPLALVAALMLALSGWQRGALVWLLAIGLSLGTMAVLKMALFACGPLHIGDLVQSPSGHTASAAIVYGGLAGLVARRYGAALVPAFLPALVAAAAIGFSRLALDVHTLAEVLIGGTIGSAGALGMLLGAGTPPPELPLPRLLAPALAVIIIMHGYHLYAEAALRTLAYRYGWLAPFCTAS